MNGGGKQKENQKVEKPNVSEKSLKSKALEFIRSLTPKQIGTVLREGEVMYNDLLDCFFVWEDSHLTMYVNENTIKKTKE